MKLEKEREKIFHPIPPFYNADSKILILGSFPSVKSREQKFFYGHKMNRFWPLLSFLFDCKTPESIDEKKAFLTKNKIALWDVIGYCEISGSDDSSIKNPVANDLTPVLLNSKTEKIYTNGKTAYNNYMKLIYPEIHKPAIYLPSTSPANAIYTFEKLVNEWKIIKDKE